MDISDAARRTGLTPGALRHYEERGLLDGRHVTRRPNGYRSYTPEGIERIRLIATGRSVGLSLPEIADGIDSWESGAMTEAARDHLFRRHIAELDARIDELARARAHLLAKTAAAGARPRGHGDPTDAASSASAPRTVVP